MASYTRKKEKTPTRHAAPYRDAIYWLARNDDNWYLRDWLKDSSDPLDKPALSVTASCVADLYRREDWEVFADLCKEIIKYDAE